MKTRYIDPQLVRELLHYDPETGIFTWKIRSREHFSSARDWKRWNTCFSGKEAGSIWKSRHGYKRLMVGVKAQNHPAHRIAWTWMTGLQAPEILDHKDGNALNNKWENLRSGVGVNARNSSLRKDSKSGVNGVHWDKKSRKWVARGYEKGTRRRVVIGRYPDLAIAAEARKEWEKGHGYSADHGRRTPYGF